MEKDKKNHNCEYDTITVLKDIIVGSVMADFYNPQHILPLILSFFTPSSWNCFCWDGKTIKKHHLNLYTLYFPCPFFARGSFCKKIDFRPTYFFFFIDYRLLFNFFSPLGDFLSFIYPQAGYLLWDIGMPEKITLFRYSLR